MINNRSRGQIKTACSLLAASSFLFSSLTLAQSNDLLFESEEMRAQLAATLPARDGIFARVDHSLVDLQDNFLSETSSKPAGMLDPLRPVSQFMTIANGYVVIDAVAAGNVTQLESDIAALGATDVSAYGSMVSARIPIGVIDQLGGLNSLRYVRPSYAMANTGSVLSQGDAAQVSDDLRTNEGLDGTNITIGVLSDSFNCAATDGDPNSIEMQDDIDSGDLPALVDINILDDNCPNSDEGRGMAQLIYDVAPDSKIAFHTAFGGQAVFALGITDLVNAGANVIVDDVFNFGEPMFMDGIIAQSADAAVATGVPYFSSAGNSDVNSYEGPFVERGLVGPLGGMTHDFDPGAAGSNAQEITVPVGANFTMSFQWNQPFASVTGGAPAATTDLNIYVFGKTLDVTSIVAIGITNNIVSGDPIEVISFTNTGFDFDFDTVNDTMFFIVIENFSGPNPTEMKYSYSDSGSGVIVVDFDTSSGTSYGHSSAANAESVGAAAYFDTPDFGTDPPALESFSSRANVPIYFDTAGNLISPPDLRLKPEITAPDGGNTTFFGNDIGLDADAFPNFFGTSAAAPHAAGVAALLLESNGSLAPAEIYSVMEGSALDILPAGFDFDSGHGLIQATTSFDALGNVVPTLADIPSQSGVTGQQLVFDLTYADNETAVANMTLAQTGMPGFCTFNPDTDGSGNITCNITANDTGRFAVAVTATDVGTDAGAGIPSRIASQGLYVIANENTEPTLDAFNNNQQMNDNEVLVINLTGSDPDPNDTLTFSAAGAPGFCVPSTTGTGAGDITCTPGYNNTGAYVIGAQILDDGTPVKTDSAIFTLSVANVNRDPTLNPIGPQNVDEGQQIIINGSATDPDVPDALTLDSDEPAFCIAVDNGDGTGSLTCDPTFDDAGAYNITVTVTDSFAGMDQETFTLTVNDINRPPVLDFIGNYVVANNAVLVINITSSDPDGDGLQLSNALPGFCVNDYSAGATGSITCTPTGPGDNGTYSVTVTATDNGVGTLFDDETFDIVVGDAGALNTTPVLDPIGNQFVADTSQLVIPLSSNDANGHNMSFVNTSGLPAFCVLNDGNGAGDLTCNPTFGDAGFYNVAVRVTDDGTPALTDTEIIQIEVLHLNQPPTAHAGPDQEVVTPALVFLDGTNSMDIEGPIAAYSWRFAAVANGSALTNLQIFDRFTSVPSFIPDVDGTYILEVEVTDAANDKDVDTVSVLSESANFLYFIDELNNRISIRSTVTGANLGDVPMTHGVETINGGSGLAAHPHTNDMYAALRINGDATTRHLATVNPLTGAATIMGDMGDEVQGLTFNSSGTLFAVTGDLNANCPGSTATTADTLYTVDLTSGAMTFEQTLGNGGCNEVIAYNPDDDTIYHASGAGTQVFETINLDTDDTTDIPYGGDTINAFSVHGLVYDPVQDLFLGTMFNFDSASLEYFSVTAAGVVNTITSPLNALSFEWRGHAFFDFNFQPPAIQDAQGDHNGDGRADIVWRNTLTGHNYVYQMNGATQAFGTDIRTVFDTDWEMVGNNDHDGDGQSDILWRNKTTGQNWIYLMDGASRADSVGVNTVPDTDWEIVGSGDYNGDGDADIFWRNSTTGQNWVYLLVDGSIDSSVGVNTVADTDWKVVGSGDYDGDGNSDILWRNHVTGQNWIYFMVGANYVSAGINTVPGATWKIVGSGDYNGDQKSDILWRNAATGENWMYLMDGADVDQTLGVNTFVGADWEVVGNGDYNGDTKSDILWRNSATGQNWMYLMDGANIDSSVGVNEVAGSEWTVNHSN